MDRYEYKVLRALSLPPECQLDELGEDGWQLVTITHGSVVHSSEGLIPGAYYFYLYFKRLVKEVSNEC